MSRKFNQRVGEACMRNTFLALHCKEFQRSPWGVQTLKFLAFLEFYSKFKNLIILWYFYCKGWTRLGKNGNEVLEIEMHLIINLLGRTGCALVACFRLIYVVSNIDTRIILFLEQHWFLFHHSNTYLIFKANIIILTSTVEYNIHLIYYNRLL